MTSIPTKLDGLSTGSDDGSAIKEQTMMQVMSLTKRSFIKFLGMALAGAPMMSLSQSREAAFDVSGLNVSVPLWLLQDGDPSLTATLVSVSNLENRILLRFSQGAEVALNRFETPLRIAGRDAKAMRQRMLMKRLNASLIMAAFDEYRNNRGPNTSDWIRKDFDNFQSQEVLDNLSVGSVIDLLKQLPSCRQFIAVRWSFAMERFDVLCDQWDGRLQKGAEPNPLMDSLKRRKHDGKFQDQRSSNLAPEK